MADAVEVAATPAADQKITCQIDGVLVHSVELHIKKNHPDWTVERYRTEFPDSPLLSVFAEETLKRKIEERKGLAARNAVIGASPAATGGPIEAVIRYVAMNELFELGTGKAAMGATGNPIQVPVMSGHDPMAIPYLAETDSRYVYNIDLLKKVLAGLTLNMPIYLWGMHGSGKTTVLQQIAARMQWPVMRVQHTVNMQESDVLGQWTVRDGSTHFQLGPLPTAMLNGWVYLADEYDFAMPAVTSVYQPVLEGQSLLIKDAPPMFRKITPHPNFRFCATGNTNGTGDETGLYQGTMIQNAANYSRFQITEEVKYMSAKEEKTIIGQRSPVSEEVASNLVRFAENVRTSFAAGKIGTTISLRELIAAARLSHVFGDKPVLGLQLAFANRLSRVDQKVVEEFAQRIFGK